MRALLRLKHVYRFQWKEQYVQKFWCARVSNNEFK